MVAQLCSAVGAQNDELRGDLLLPCALIVMRQSECRAFGSAQASALWNYIMISIHGGLITWLVPREGRKGDL